MHRCILTCAFFFHTKHEAIAFFRRIVVIANVHTHYVLGVQLTTQIYLMRSIVFHYNCCI